jgi:hypothetical protein
LKGAKHRPETNLFQNQNVTRNQSFPSPNAQHLRIRGSAFRSKQ